MNLEENLRLVLDRVTDLPVYLDSLGDGESVCLARLPGGKVIQQFMDGDADKLLTFEVVSKVHTSNRRQGVESMDCISNVLTSQKALVSGVSDTDKYEVLDLEISSELFFDEAKTDGYVYFRMHFQTLVASEAIN